jgi:hypothetical protein
MRFESIRRPSPWTISALVLAALLVLSACSISVKKDQTGQDKRVDIETPVGALHVDEQADARDTGLPVYPGARLKPKDDSGEGKSANVNISSGLFGLKVVAAEYQSDDAPQKLIAYYKNQLKKYGNVLECRSEHASDVAMSPSQGSGFDLGCNDDNSGKNIELKVGTRDNQRIVAIEPRDKGTTFALVYVKTRGKDTI